MEYATLGGEVRKPKGRPDVLEFVASTDHVDRGGDVVEQNWDLRGLRKNPVFLWAHRYAEPPVGKMIRIWTERVEDKAHVPGRRRTKIQVRFVPDDVYPFAGTVRRMYEDGFLQAVSVGFRPLRRRDVPKDEREELGMGPYSVWFERSELLEVSAVPVPMNPHALQTSVSRGYFGDEASARILWEPDRERQLAGCDWEAALQALEEMGDDIETKPGLEETSTSFRWRVRDPGLFSKLRTITLTRKPRTVRAVVGRLKKDDGATHLQSVVFPKAAGWTRDEVQKWIREHKDDLKGYDFGTGDTIAETIEDGFSRVLEGIQGRDDRPEDDGPSDGGDAPEEGDEVGEAALEEVLDELHDLEDTLSEASHG